jgi:hypothetical protein
MIDHKTALAKALRSMTAQLANKAGHMTHAKGPTLNSPGVSHAEGLIKAGKVDDGEWSFAAADEDALLGKDDWDSYEKWFLAIDNDETDKTRGHYKYPVGKDGKVYVRALNAIRSRASQQGATSIYDAAGKLLDMINKGK